MLEVWPISFQWEPATALYAPGSFPRAQTPRPSHQGTGPVGQREGREGYLPAQAGWARLPSDVMESWPAAAGSHRSWLSRLASTPLTTAWSPNIPTGHQGPRQGLLGPHCSIFCLLISSLCFVSEATVPSPNSSPPWDGSTGRGLWPGTNHFQMPLATRHVRGRHWVFSHRLKIHHAESTLQGQGPRHEGRVSWRDDSLGQDPKRRG